MKVTRDVGQETVQYVRTVYKYYVAYRLAVEQGELRKKTTLIIRPRTPTLLMPETDFSPLAIPYAVC